MEILDTLWQLVLVLRQLVVDLIVLAGFRALLLFWLAWALLAINWPKVWPWLARGAWAPAVLILFLIALIWSRLTPVSCSCLGFVTVPNFWWQLGEVGLFAALTLFCGWLQGKLGWTPPEISFDPPAPASHGHDHH